MFSHNPIETFHKTPQDIYMGHITAENNPLFLVRVWYDTYQFIYTLNPTSELERYL